MKGKNKITAALAAVTVVLAGANGIVLLGEDRRPPRISFPETAAVWQEGMDDSLLLEGVTAEDDRDGNVTDSLRLREVLPSADRTEATVIYVAKDSSNNIVQASRVLQAGDGSGETAQTRPESQGTDTAEGNGATAEQPAQPVTAAPEPTGSAAVTPEDPEEAGRQENEAAIAELPPEAPRLYLSQYTVTLPAGSDFNPLSYVSDVTDDADSRDTMFTRISVDGEADTQTPGTYDVYLFANDSEGNSSNRAHLTVTVQ